MSTAFTQIIQAIGADLEIAELPPLATFFNALQANSKLPLVAQKIADAAAVVNLEASAVASIPSLETTIAAQLNTLVQSKLSAALAAAQAKVPAA